jgi:trimeric autotransporter adhesin
LSEPSSSSNGGIFKQNTNINENNSTSVNAHSKNPATIPSSSPSLSNKQYHASNNNISNALQPKDPTTNQINDLTQIKYLKNNYNIQYYPSDFISFTQQSQENLVNSNAINQTSPSSAISPSQNSNKFVESKPNASNNTSSAKLSDFIINNGNNNANNVNTAKNNSVSSSSSSSTTSSSSSHSNKSLPNNNIKQPYIATQHDINTIDVNGFLSSLNQKKTSPSPQKSTTSTSNSASNQNDLGEQQNGGVGTNLKNVKSLTNLYESKFTYQQQQQAPTTSSTLRQMSMLPSSSSKLNNSSTQIDFNSIFNSKINPNANTSNSINHNHNNNNNNSTGANPNQLSSSSSTSTSSSSSSSNHPLNHNHHHQSALNQSSTIPADFNNNLKNLDNQNQFQSRSLNAFNNSQQQQQQQQNRDEINLSVKNVIKLLETNSLNSSSQPPTTASSTASSTNSQPSSTNIYPSYGNNKQQQQQQRANFVVF